MKVIRSEAEFLGTLHVGNVFWHILFFKGHPDYIQGPCRILRINTKAEFPKVTYEVHAMSYEEKVRRGSATRAMRLHEAEQADYTYTTYSSIRSLTDQGVLLCAEEAERYFEEVTSKK